ncbi:unnamed protein product [Oikopleura dioica]|uniref:BHLH domain-containing protein n=1 Tax=Oikopleura dioica TaxID=34765 RepID=E4WVF2_OIKDI|nr:unnamed protein product [Oikopleura dioica]
MNQINRTQLKLREGITKNPSTTSTLSEREIQATKPLMEKRRRERMNKALNEMKNLLLEVMGRDVTCHSKLEKADILENAVDYLKTLRAFYGMLPSPHMYNSREAVRQRLPARQKSACQLSTTPFLPGCRIPLSPISSVYANPYTLAQFNQNVKRAKLEPNLEKAIFSNNDSSSTGTNPRDSDSEPEVEITIPAVTQSLTRAKSAVESASRPAIGMKRKRYRSSPDNGPFRPWITQ